MSARDLRDLDSKRPPAPHCQTRLKPKSERRATPASVTSRRADPILLPLDALRPTQVAVGMRAVGAKREKIESHARCQKKIGRFLADRPIPVIRGPGSGLYIIDHHHLGLALWQTRVCSAYVEIVDDLSDVPRRRFWTEMEAGGWLHPFDEAGRRIPPRALPKALSQLRADPYRDLAWSVREKGGFKKTTAPFAEFSWAHFFRPRIPAALVAGNYPAAIRKAMALACSDVAAGLPGYRGKA